MIKVYLSVFWGYARQILSAVPGWHWAVLGALALACTGFLSIRKRVPMYGAVVVGLTVFAGLFLVETGVVARWCGSMPHGFGVDLSLGLNRLFPTSSRHARLESMSNIAVFAPFGFFMAEALAALRRYGAWRSLGLATLAGLALSLLIELLQLLLRVGYFELTDLVLNTAGAFAGAVAAVVLRKGGEAVLARRAKEPPATNTTSI